MKGLELETTVAGVCLFPLGEAKKDEAVSVLIVIRLQPNEGKTASAWQGHGLEAMPATQKPEKCSWPQVMPNYSKSDMTTAELSAVVYDSDV